ncbi:MAG: hypothetical protein XU11_C0022G0045 [Candidatus Dadabacteria bacterium CSP1-2]|nr:MAG: hypothetical protein XU11_C0022G0045 [Candidatus Dadabacteria bacterium CSP1-2]
MLNYTRNLLKRSNTHSKTKSNTLEIAAGYRHLNRHSLVQLRGALRGVYPEVSKGSGLRRELSRTTNSVTKQSQKDEIASLGSWVSPIPPIQSGAGSRGRVVGEPNIE